MLRCPACSRVSPPEARFCPRDGRALRGEPATEPRFPAPLVFPDGRECWSCAELTQACLAEWAAGAELLREGSLALFFGRVGRTDLADSARAAAAFADADAALDRFLRAIGDEVPEARLEVSPERIAFQARPGEEGCWVIRLRNAGGGGALYGTASVDVPWLALGGPKGPAARWFCCRDEAEIAVFVRPGAVRACARRQAGGVRIASSGGEAVVEVSLDAPAVSFREGALAGAAGPRDLASRARQAPREAAHLFASGAVERWYQANGWTYPLAPGGCGGLGLVQEYFELLGLARPAAVELSPAAVTLEARPGEAVEASLRLRTSERRPVCVRAVADRPWLGVSVEGGGSEARIIVRVAAVGRPGEVLAGRVTITANGRRTFHVPVILRVAAPAPVIDWLPAAAPPPPLRVAAPGDIVLTPVRPARRARALAVLLPLALLGVVVLAGFLAALALPAASPTAIPAASEAPHLPAPAAQPPRSGRETDVPAPPRLADVRPRQQPADARPFILLAEMENRTAEVVFCLDTTGSMGGLLDGARKKVWSMCSQIAGGQPVPDLRVGLVAFRDRGDEYITRVVGLSPDLDAVYGELTALEAKGGDDHPESVNQALDDAVNKVKWSSDKKTLRIIFLVGDAPPHMDYEDDVKYALTCQKAVDKGILINTIQCGDDAECRRYWKDIAAKAKGEYVAIPRGGGVVTIVTKFDAPLADLGKDLFATALIYGGPEQKKRGARMLEGARRLTGLPAADRVAYAARAGRLGPDDLLDALKAKRVKLADVKESELPEALRQLGAGQRQAHLDKMAARRKELFAEALVLEGRRAAVVAAERAKRGGAKDSFDEQVLGLLRKQAKAFDIKY